MYHCEGRFSTMIELNSENDIFLFSFLNNNLEEYRKFVSDQNIPSTYTEFTHTLKTWFSGGRMYQFLVYSKYNKKHLIGTIFFYGYDKQSGYVKMSAFFEKKFRNQLPVAESLGMAITFVKQIIKAKEVYFSVYLENKNMIRIAKKMGFVVVYVSPSAVNPKRKIETYKIKADIVEKISNMIQKLHR